MYRFTGFFARPSIEQPGTLPAEAAWRNITAPFVGIGIRLPRIVNDEPGPDEARELLAEFELGDVADWLFINYVTWAGSIESVYGLGSASGRGFGPLGESSRDKVQATYLELMGKFGVMATDALNFPPFVRGFWGE